MFLHALASSNQPFHGHDFSSVFPSREHGSLSPGLASCHLPSVFLPTLVLLLFLKLDLITCGKFIVHIKDFPLFYLRNVSFEYSIYATKNTMAYKFMLY